MYASARTILLIGSFALIVSGCASNEEIVERRAAINADIDEILSLTLESEDFGEPERCITESQYRNFELLGDRYMLFEGSRDRLWINTLRGRCVEHTSADVLITRPFSARRLCDGDRFEVTDWFDLPRSVGRLPSGPTCSFGKFQPVSQGQVDEIEALLEEW
ncbi:MAG: hypothetical protein QNI99_10210 [Woeseiaceae bacterium]|nr:hypothetical protein [Woeseiaceae bacterium]